MGMTPEPPDGLDSRLKLRYVRRTIKKLLKGYLYTIIAIAIAVDFLNIFQ